jgi:hypothetical protein
MRKLNMGSYSKMTHIYTRIINLLKNGFDLCAVKYLFLAMSSSQLREHGKKYYYTKIKSKNGLKRIKFKINYVFKTKTNNVKFTLIY